MRPSISRMIGVDVAAGLVLAVDLPASLAGRSVEGHQVGVAVVIAVDDHLVFEQHRATAIAVLAGESARADEPLLLAGEVVGRHDHLGLRSRNVTYTSSPSVAGVLEAKLLS